MLGMPRLVREWRKVSPSFYEVGRDIISTTISTTLNEKTLTNEFLAGGEEQVEQISTMIGIIGLGYINDGDQTSCMNIHVSRSTHLALTKTVAKKQRKKETKKAKNSTLKPVPQLFLW